MAAVFPAALHWHLTVCDINRDTSIVLLSCSTLCWLTTCYRAEAGRLPSHFNVTCFAAFSSAAASWESPGRVEGIRQLQRQLTQLLKLPEGAWDKRCNIVRYVLYVSKGCLVFNTG
jgi:hypothetical protein